MGTDGSRCVNGWDMYHLSDGMVDKKFSLFLFIRGKKKRTRKKPENVDNSRRLEEGPQ